MKSSHYRWTLGKAFFMEPHLKASNTWQDDEDETLCVTQFSGHFSGLKNGSRVTGGVRVPRVRPVPQEEGT